MTSVVSYWGFIKCAESPSQFHPGRNNILLNADVPLTETKSPPLSTGPKLAVCHGICWLNCLRSLSRNINMQMSAMMAAQGHVATFHFMWEKEKTTSFPSFSGNTSTQSAAVEPLNYKWCTYKKRNEDIYWLGVFKSVTWPPLDYHMISTDCLTPVARCGHTTISSRAKMC